MKRLALAVIGAILLAGTAFAEQQQSVVVTKLQASDDNYSFLVGTGATVYTQSFPMVFGDKYAVLYKTDSSVNYGTSNLSIFLQQSDRLPVTEGSPDTFWATLPGLNIIATGQINRNTAQIASFSAIALPYGRLMIRENSQRSSDNWISISIGQMGQTVK